MGWGAPIFSTTYDERLPAFSTGEMALPLKDAMDIENPAFLIKDAPDKLSVTADHEERAFKMLKEIAE